jgi:Holliday junction resolvase-like predicted endonuclease
MTTTYDTLMTVWNDLPSALNDAEFTSSKCNHYIAGFIPAMLHTLGAWHNGDPKVEALRDAACDFGALVDDDSELGQLLQRVIAATTEEVAEKAAETKREEKRKARKTITNYIQSKPECEILAHGYKHLFVFQEGDELVFAECLYCTDGDLRESRKTRRDFERTATEYLFKNSLPSSQVRFDVISVRLCDDGKAFLRHHKDAMGSDAA